MKQTIQKQLPAACPWGESIHCFDTIDSTNTKAKELAIAGAPHGTVVVAKHQTQGRGRMGRRFHSPAGLGLYLSVILRPRCKPEDMMHLTCACGVAACNAVESLTGIRPGIKWTNDLVIGHSKLGGILTELSLSDGMVNYAILGIGINCGHDLTDFPAELRTFVTSIKLATGKDFETAHLASRLIYALWEMDKELLTGKQKWMDAYRRHCITLNKDISILRGDEVFHAKALDIDNDGGLVILTADGTKQTVQSGEVSIRGMYGYIR